jgi:hypothetical protein
MMLSKVEMESLKHLLASKELLEDFAQFFWLCIWFCLTGAQGLNKKLKYNKPIIPTSTRCAHFVGISGRYTNKEIS